MSNPVVTLGGPAVTIQGIAGALPSGYVATGTLPVYDTSKAEVSTGTGVNGWTTSYSGQGVVQPVQPVSESSSADAFDNDTASTDNDTASTDAAEPDTGTFSIQAASNATGTPGTGFLAWNGQTGSASSYCYFDLQPASSGTTPLSLTASKWFGAPAGGKPNFFTSWIRLTVGYENQLTLALAYSDADPTISSDGQSSTMPPDDTFSYIAGSGTAPNHNGVFGYESFLITLPFYLRANLVNIIATDNGGSTQRVNVSNFVCYSTGDRANLWTPDGNRWLPAPRVIDQAAGDVSTGYAPTDFPASPMATVTLDTTPGDTMTGYEASTANIRHLLPGPVFHRPQRRYLRLR